MSPLRLTVLGQTVPALLRIAAAGELLGMERGTAYRAAGSDSWPMTGQKGSRWVVLPALLDRMGITYQVEAGEADDDTA